MEQPDTNDTFFCKLVLNLLYDFTETYSEYSLLHRFAYDSILEGPWFVDLRAQVQASIDDEKGMLGTSVLRSLVGRSDVRNLVEQIYAVHPELRERLSPRETSKTLGELLELSDLEIQMLDAACRFPDMNYTQRSMLDNIDMRFKSVGDLYSTLLRASTKEAQKAANGILFNAGILSKDGCAPDGLYGLNSDLHEVFSNKNLKVEEIDEAMFPHMLQTELNLDDYAHISKEVTRCIDLIENGQKKAAAGKGGINLMFWGLPGCGKCLDPDEPVLMWDGTIKISKDIVLGDFLMGPDSTPRTVLSTSWGRGEMFEVIPKKGRSFRCNADHILSMKRTGGDETIFVEVREWLTWSPSKRSRWKLWRCGVDFSERQEPPIDPYFIGALLGDGSVGRKISLHSVDQEIIDMARREAVKWKMELREYQQPNRNIEYCFVSGPPSGGASSPLRDTLHSLDMMRSCGDKQIHHVYKTSSRVNRLQLLAGLLDTDGHYYGSFDFVSKSQQLAEDTAFVARSVGLAAYTKQCTKKSQNGTTGIYYRVIISGDLTIIPTRITRKKANPRRQVKDVLKTGFDVVPVGQGDYFGITLDGDHQYLMSDFTVTHNTELAVAMAKARGWNLKVIGDISPDKLEENSRSSRITSLKLATKIFRNQPKTVLLFDEMEDLFKQDTNAQFSKAFINRIIETTNIPIIWTTNNLEMLGQPVLRRMVYNIGFEIPPEEVRKQMWKKYAATFKVKVDDEAINKVARVYPIAPALIRNAMRVTSTAFGRKKVKPEELTEIVGSLDTLVNYGMKNLSKVEDEATPATYDLSCVNTDHDLGVFTKRLVDTKSKGFALCMYGPPGTGKCLGPDEPVLMYDGTTKISRDLIIGDLLMGPDSKPRKVLSTAWGHGPMFEVRPFKGKSWKCNGDHILSLRASQKRARGKIITTTVNDWLKWSDSKKSSWLQWRTAVDFEKREKSPIDPYLIGLFLGDGSCSDTGTLSIHSVDHEISSYLKEQADKLGMVLRERVYSGKSCVDHAFVLGGRGHNKPSSHLREALKELDMMKTCENKTVPIAIKYGSRDDRRRVLAGLIDTDGHYDRDGGVYDFISKSKNLSDDVCFLARSIGLAAYVVEKFNRSQNGAGGTYHRVCISGNLDQLPILIERKKARARRANKDVTNVGFDIVPIGDGDWFGITLDGDHLYLLDDFTVTHNTEYGRYLAHKMGKEVLFKRASDLQSMWVGECHSDDTEFLTSNGPKFFDDITKDDLLGTINPITGFLEFQAPTERLSRQYTGYMKHFKHSNIDALVTPRHRMWTRGLKRRENYAFHYADEIGNVRYPFNNKIEMMTAPTGWDGENLGLISINPSTHPMSADKPTVFDPNKFMEFVGYFVTEGSLSNDNRKNIYLSQKEGFVQDRMLELAKYVGGSAWVIKDHRGRADSIKIAHAGLYDWLLENCGRYSNEKHIPLFFMGASSAQLRIMLDAMIEGDGHRPSKGTASTFTFNLTSQLLSEQIGEISMKLGLSVRHSIVTARGNRKQQWSVYATPRREKGINKSKDIRDVNYDGRVVCFRVPNETLLTRRNGRWLVSGNCEKNIAAAFAEAKRKGMVLLIDEGDSFLRDRTKARQSWEVSQVNEMLSQMERHPEPFVLTTNLMADLDSASLRRFTFKLKFDYMKPEQTQRLFKGFFGMDAPKGIEFNHMLVPGDYANVKRQVEILGISSRDDIYRMLEEETKLKPGNRGAIGIR